ncbi:nuclear transport factor 2 family protein [Kordia algicida OT-1]|uniref:SnoaL-like domain-containing protein n=1 Tax=Kordia algicida OT-1 TaxID=391587 RepID=A9DM86_9FLAO|nr:nuclear transport factor 2 family protein [Kordia algicida]EDP97650.1 hypothetical protein KAOT1_20847 [Kordia algicida OT-1]
MKKLIILLFLTVSVATAQQQNEAAKVIQKQVEAYNARDIDAFLANYSDDFIFYDFNKEVRFKGIEQMREVFGNLFQNNPDLQCTIANRIASGNTVVDHEKVRFKKGTPIREFVIMYIVEDEKIKEAYFLKRPQ